MTTSNFYESLNELVTDSRFRSLTVTQNFENFLGQNGINEAENMHTFSWFLQPKGSHGLRDTFLKEFITTAWTMVHGQYGDIYKGFKATKFYSALSPLMLQHTSFINTFVDRTVAHAVPGADIVITDVDAKLMVIINNRYNKAVCDKVIAHFGSEKYAAFERKMYVSFDAEAYHGKDASWMYMNNEWLINLCSNLIDCPQYANMKISGHLRDFYQFLTGSQYGTSHEQMAHHSATLISDYYGVIRDLKTYKAEKVPSVCLVDINPRDYASVYAGKISEKEYGVLSLYWSYQNTFRTFFELCDLETVTRDLEKTVATKSYGFDRSFIRNGLRYTPCFTKTTPARAFWNTIFDVEMIQDLSKNLTLNLVINKDAWDKLTVQQREAVQKNFGFAGSLLKDRVVVWNAFYKQDWKTMNLSKEVVSLFEKVDHYLSTIGSVAA